MKKPPFNWAQSIAASLVISIATILTIVTVTLVAIHATGSNSTFGEVWTKLWPLFTVILFFVFLILLFFFRYPFQFFCVGLFLAAFVFVFASFQGNDLSALVKKYIDSIFFIDYLSTGATLAALILAILAVWKRDSNQDHD